MSFLWPTIWTVVWFASLLIFSLLAVVVIYKGFGDLVWLLKSLKERSDSSDADSTGPQS